MRRTSFGFSTFCLPALLGISLFSFAPGAAAASPENTFQLRKGDRVVFLGDSLTASRAYSDVVELYSLLTYPDRNIRFFNAGQGGDTALGALKRLPGDVLAHKPTVVTVCFGVNDIGWGVLATPEFIQGHYDGMRAIIQRCQKVGARVYVLGPCATRLTEKARPQDPRDKDVLGQMSDKDRAIAEELGASFIPLYDQFRAVQWRIRKDGREKDFPTHAGDGIHLSELGNLIFAEILLKGLGAPDVVSSVTINLAEPELVGVAEQLPASFPIDFANTLRCRVSSAAMENNVLRFTRRDEGWPMRLEPFPFNRFAYAPLPETLAQYRLKITGIKGSSWNPGLKGFSAADWFLIRVNGRDLATVTSKTLTDGMNLAYTTPNFFEPFPPWKAQASIAETLQKARSGVASTNWPGGEIDSADKDFTRRYKAAVVQEMARIEQMQRELLKPKPLRFEIIPTSEPKPAPPADLGDRFQQAVEQLRKRRAEVLGDEDQPASRPPAGKRPRK